VKILKTALFLLVTAPTCAFSQTKDFKPVENVEIKYFYSSRGSFIPLSEGTGLEEGFNLYAYESGYWEPSGKFSLNYTLRQNLNEYFSKGGIYKAYANYKPGIFSFTFGKTSKTVGPSENSLILSKNAPPFLMLDLDTAEPVKFLGEWKFNILNGWLDEKRLDLDDTRIIIVRAEYSPARLVNIALTRFSQYGGEGRPGFKLWEYPKMLLGSKENQSFDKYDTDGYFGCDLAFDLSGYFKKLDAFKVYFQQIATDVSAPWQKEDEGEISFPFVFKLQANSYQAGLEIKKASDTFNLELTTINDLFYVHHYYNIEGYSYKGYSLGNPYGNHLWELYFSRKHSLEDGDYFKYKAGFLRQPAVENTRTNYAEKMNKFYLEGELSKTKGEFVFTPYLRLEYDRNYDADGRPMHYDIKTANKLFIITGLSTKIRF